MKPKILLAALLIGLTPQAHAWDMGEMIHHYAEKHVEQAAEGGYESARNHISGAGNPGISQMNLTTRATVAFSPDGGGERIIVDAIGRARQQILVQAYGFTDKAILGALVEAKRRGIDVRIILDKSNETQKYSGATYVANAGIPVWIDYKPAIAHNKVMIIDQSSVVTGSFNFTSSAQQRNAENVLILDGVPTLAVAYIKDWNWRLGESRPYQR